MDRDLKELLIGSFAIVLFSVAAMSWPAFDRFIDITVFSHLRRALALVMSYF